MLTYFPVFKNKVVLLFSIFLFFKVGIINLIKLVETWGKIEDQQQEIYKDIYHYTVCSFHYMMIEKWKHFKLFVVTGCLFIFFDKNSFLLQSNYALSWKRFIVCCFIFLWCNNRQIFYWPKKTKIVKLPIVHVNDSFVFW